MMLMKISALVKSLRNQKKLTQIELSDKLKMSIGIIGMVESGKRMPSKETARRLSKFFNVPIQAFLDDEFDFNESDIETASLIPYYDVEVSAGNGIYSNSEFISSYLRVSNGEFLKYLHDIKKPALIAIKGQSMQPTLNDRDLIIVDADDTEIRDGEIYVVCIDEQVYIKRLFKNPIGKKITIKSDNPLFPPYDVAPTKITINGRLVMRMFDLIK